MSKQILLEITYDSCYGILFQCCYIAQYCVVVVVDLYFGAANAKSNWNTGIITLNWDWLVLVSGALKRQCDSLNLTQLIDPPTRPKPTCLENQLSLI